MSCEVCPDCGKDFELGSPPPRPETPVELTQEAALHAIGGHVIKDSGRREEFSTGSRRDTREGKGRFDLLPPAGLARLARHFEVGAKKYGDSNWKKGQPASRFMDSALRHAFKHLAGERDEDHLIAAVWNLLCLADQDERLKLGQMPKELDDLAKVV